MNEFTNKIKNLSALNYYFLIFVIGYLPVILFGTFIEDDRGIVNLGYKNIPLAIEHMCAVNNNRPLSCVYFGLLTRLFPNFQIYFLFIYLIYSLFIYIILKVFDFLILDNVVKKIFITFLIFPFFSYTILYSPAMQGIGALSLLLWSISILYLKKYLIEQKKINLFLSFFFIIILFLVYESSAPLLGISFFFPLLFNKIKAFVINFVVIILLLIFVYYLQKIIFPIIFDIDLSRIKLSISDFKQIFLLILINTALLLNIIFYSLEIFIRNIYFNTLSFNINFYIQLISLLFIVFLSFRAKPLNIITLKKQNSILQNYTFVLMILSVCFLTILMHVLANTGIEFLKYNNRALTSLSFLFAFISLISFYIFGQKKRNLMIVINFISFFIFIFNFLTFQNNMIKENFVQKNIVNEAFVNEELFQKKMIFTIIKNEHNRSLLSYNSLNMIAKIKQNNPILKNYIFRNINKFKFCNKSYWNEYIKEAYFEKNFTFDIIFFSVYGKKYYELRNVNPINIEITLEDHFQCKGSSQKISKLLKRKSYLDKRYESIFMSSLKFIFFSFYE